MSMPLCAFNCDMAGPIMTGNDGFIMMH
jgi:hypothetical protein